MFLALLPLMCAVWEALCHTHFVPFGVGRKGDFVYHAPGLIWEVAV